VKHFDRHSITWPIWSLKGEQNQMKQMSLNSLPFLCEHIKKIKKWQQLLVSVGRSRAAPSCSVEKKKMREKSHLYFQGIRAPHGIKEILEKIFFFSI
jgi:hypothetical protein